MRSKGIRWQNMDGEAPSEFLWIGRASEKATKVISYANAVYSVTSVVMPEPPPLTLSGKI